MKRKYKKAFTLVELLVAILLLGMVVMTGVTVELAMRRMQIKPEAQAKLLDELIPVVERIKKDFYGQIGTLDNTSVWINGPGSWLAIRVDDGTYPFRIDADDHWHAYRWNGSDGDPIEYSYSNFTAGYERIAEGIIDFDVSTSHSGTALDVKIGTERYPGGDPDPIINPSAYLNTTIFSRMASGR